LEMRWKKVFEKTQFLRVATHFLKTFLKKDHFCVYDNVFFEKVFEKRQFLGHNKAVVEA
jgi:hypothetical protein